ncbi:MAG TPA: PilZ domain-containing protein [Sandaracinaceae bacterium LLY-WYZ-13_1]|nr:PilZ domain-containing protein [Sandaracinaceae bacterium LLY-WYZ-13_1]
MERRAKERYRVWFPMTVVTEEGDEGTAITFDVSAGGLLMACPGRLEVGTPVTLRFKISGDDAEERRIAAEVVRVEPGFDEEGPWRFRMAVRFAAPQPDLEGVLREHAED